MGLNSTKCYRCVGEIKNMIKYEKTKSGNQRYIFKLCRRTRVENYANQDYKSCIDGNIVQLTKEGLGIRSTARLLWLYQPQYYRKGLFQLP
ncbi:hypothetical protein [Flavobacterium sp. 245]|uniref:hypothetical protein n=1 Tax=Flavobacterium sp. 245 TaxID=2512115 RepID=UPI0010E7359C|nr:hypothetical protein [Flavobacterium sp. 245]TDO96093.1 hypothetical protein EV145_11266 [Flavobacterium sp. 245]